MLHLQSLNTRDIFPDHHKIAVVTPLYKKRDKTNMTNYRHISLYYVSYI